MKGFKQFLMRGNVIDLAVAVVVGAAFGSVVTALVKDLITPMIAAVVRQPDFSAITFQLNGSKFLLGDFLNALFSFVMIAAAVYFAVVLPATTLMSRMGHGPAKRKCPECLSEVPAAARRCAFCTSPLA
jgi:large conductance mechanosensitive channel